MSLSERMSNVHVSANRVETGLKPVSLTRVSCACEKGVSVGASRTVASFFACVAKVEPTSTAVPGTATWFVICVDGNESSAAELLWLESGHCKAVQEMAQK